MGVGGRFKSYLAAVAFLLGGSSVLLSYSSRGVTWLLECLLEKMKTTTELALGRTIVGTP